MSASDIFEFMRKHGLKLTDLYEIGGRDFRSPNPDIRRRAHQIEKCWEKIAARNLRFADLEQFATAPANRARYPRQIANSPNAASGPKIERKQISQQNQSDKTPASKAAFVEKNKQNQTLNFSPPAYCAAEPSGPVSVEGAS